MHHSRPILYTHISHLPQKRFSHSQICVFQLALQWVFGVFLDVAIVTNSFAISATIAFTIVTTFATIDYVVVTASTSCCAIKSIVIAF